MILKICPEILEYSKEVQKLCCKKYPQHPKGCPNYAKKEGCPPQPLINEVLDFKQPIYLIYTEFKIGNFARGIKKAHPEWTEKQCYNLRYWQPKARKIQRREEGKAELLFNLTKIIKSPEANGINIDSLFKKLNMPLEWPPRKITRLVSIGGYAI
ncbi:hypothetical protein COS75_00190 [Candidatus Pacearchaeota archaeon CG06_land_8_20_14_3_00_35_12]|nr:MAG: hypothetical protein COS75_00190 [Candidatus Pacearchaeota archaeon CG06_land_8_20_14_3_00_35_12]